MENGKVFLHAQARSENLMGLGFRPTRCFCEVDFLQKSCMVTRIIAFVHHPRDFLQ